MSELTDFDKQRLYQSLNTDLPELKRREENINKHLEKTA